MAAEGASNSIHDAAREGISEVVREILSTLPDSLNARDQLSRTPLHLAAWAGHADVVRVLCDAEADVGASAKDDMAAIHFASQKGHIDVVRILLAAGAYVNVRNRKGMSALHFAVQGGRGDVTKLLIQKGANLSAENKAGKRPIDLVRDHSMRALINEAEVERNARRSKGKKDKPAMANEDASAEEFRPITVPERPQTVKEDASAGEMDRVDDENFRPITVPERPKTQMEDATAAGETDTENPEDFRPITVPERPNTEWERGADATGKTVSTVLGNVEPVAEDNVAKVERTGNEFREPKSKKAKVSLSLLSFDNSNEDDIG